ncbi:thymopoietin a isoform X2 [Sparus aurata]|uniref:Thymopoietin a n=1 Tax=Sparus aurata TaxID=8175 RepID=A0A671V601_SPAAU|nr:thymopoietin isoform X2 [Sparus aurata]
MPEYLDDPSVLTKDKLKSELLAHNVELPSGNPTKDVYVQLYLKNLTAQNNQHVTATTLDAFSSDEELPPPVVSSRSRSSGRKATRKTDKVRPDELDVTVLTDQGLKDELLKHGVDAGPIVASTRKLYEKKLQKLLDDGPVQPPLPELVLTEIEVNHNGNSESDLYSDKEDELTVEPEPEPVAEPEPAPVVERPLGSRGKVPVTTRTRSSQHTKRDQLMDDEDDDDDDDDEEELVLQVKRRSRRLSRRVIVPEDLRPALTEQGQSNRRVHHRLDSPVRSEPPSASSRPAQLHGEELGLRLTKPSEDLSYKPVALLNTTLLEELEPLGAAAMSLSKEQSIRPATKPSRPTRVDPVTFSPMCNISPIKTGETRCSLSDQFGSKPSRVSAAGECGPPDVLLYKRRQQKMTSFLSSCSPTKTLGCTSTLSKDMLVRQVEKIAASEQAPKVEEKDVLKELFSNDINSPTGITATCRRPIRGAADRPVKSSDLWNNENSLFSPKTTKTTSSASSYTESRIINRVNSLPSSTSFSSSTATSSFSSPSSRPLAAAPPAGQTKAAARSMSLWIKLFLLAIVAAFLFLVYQAMETNTINPFGDSDTGVASGSTA